MNRVEKMIEWMSEMDRDEWVEVLDSVSIKQDERIKRLWDELQKYGKAREVVNDLKRMMEEL